MPLLLRGYWGTKIRVPLKGSIRDLQGLGFRVLGIRGLGFEGLRV